MLKGIKHKVLILGMAVVLPGSITSVSAQQKTDSTLQEIDVHAKRNASNDPRVNEFSPGMKVTAIDSATLHQYQLQSMASLLDQQSAVFIKSYGFNSLATLNFRGSSAAQSQVYWNGVPIQNAALGIADVSELPVSVIEKVNTVYGSSSALWGSGNVGGALLLENNLPVFDSGKHSFSVSGGTGSFGQYLGGFNGSVSGRRWYLAADVFAQTAQNNFPYTNDTGATVKTTNSRLQSEAVLTRMAYKIAPQNVVSLTAWYQQYSRGIPPALFETYSDKHEVDGSLRLLAEWHRKSDKGEMYAKSSFIKDDMNYSYEAVALHWDYTTYQYYQEVGWRRRFAGNSELLLFVPVQLSWIVSPDSNLHRQQSKAAIAGALSKKFFSGRLNTAVNARAENIDGTNIFLPGINTAYNMTQWLVIRANVQRTYRAPTLNELYYYPGGNKDLKPEQGWNEDAGYAIHFKAGRFLLLHDLSVFNRDIHDWILWLGGAIWTPHNIAQVHSRGVETENRVSYDAGKWKLFIGLNTSYVLATTVSSYLYNDGSIGKQIPYTPRYNGRLSAGFTVGHLSFSYIHVYAGYRFITSDESAWLPPYQVGNMQIACNAQIMGHVVQATGQCNNIWNRQYEVVSGRPMPGINWLIGCKVQVF